MLMLMLMLLLLLLLALLMYINEDRCRQGSSKYCDGSVSSVSKNGFEFLKDSDLFLNATAPFNHSFATWWRRSHFFSSTMLTTLSNSAGQNTMLSSVQSWKCLPLVWQALGNWKQNQLSGATAYALSAWCLTCTSEHFLKCSVITFFFILFYQQKSFCSLKIWKITRQKLKGY